jgi:hypothetical protein
MSEWIRAEDALPEIIEREDGSVNVVLAYYDINKVEMVSGSQFQVSNTVYLNRHPEKFTHWMYIPEISEINANA